MNKCIISQLIMSLLVTFHANAMESVQIETDPSIPVGGVCYFGKMPTDVLNYIASFLMESDGEFIERTKIKKEVPFDLYDKFLLESTKKFLKMDDSYKIIISEFCPDESKIGILELPNQFADTVSKSLTIIDLQKNDDTRVKHSRTFDNKGNIKCIALSRDGNMIAMIYEEKECYEGEDCYYDFFEIQNITTQQTRELYIPDTFMHEMIAFNKQGTSLIAHGYVYEDIARDTQGTFVVELGKTVLTTKNTHHIFSLKIIDPLQPQVVDGPNKLQNYFRDKFISNHSIEGQK
jgi:hypothetical protein